MKDLAGMQYDSDIFQKLTNMLTKDARYTILLLYVLVFLHSCSPGSHDVNKENVLTGGKLVGVEHEVREYCTLNLYSNPNGDSVALLQENIPIRIEDDGVFYAAIRVSDTNVPYKFILKCGGYQDFAITKKVTDTTGLGIIRPLKIQNPWFVPIQGRCGHDDYREADLKEYTLLLGLYQKGSDYINIRPRPAFSRYDPILAKLPNGIWVPAIGPLKNPDYGNALAFKIPLKDSTGETCVGYVSGSVTRDWPFSFFER